ncbi:hypothetical protein NP493_579g01011 [Ridgeia piscesae]|uniref:Peptidase M12A domain-containing protein n=1 Tax=Ridgeia piscesae TaxID=27915 RepID=A0AAD9KU95_RIDPI|nr:hypothetical protein NP493_579g01011 [Ridgeia piscesae]
MDFFLFGSLPTLEQAQECVEQQKHRHKRKLLNFHNYPVYKWPMPIIYKYDGTHDADAILMIEAAIKHWETHTCIRFKRVDTNATLGIPVHELGHAIGFWHEHVRPDRDNYVTVNSSYIYWWYRINYQKLNSTLVNEMRVPYDYGSLLHYTATELSIGRLHAIEPKDPLYLKTMGQRVGLSFFDAKLANLAYCKDACAGVKPIVKCYRGGYRDPNDCSKCKCPEGFGRVGCRYPERVEGGCSPKSQGFIYVHSTRERCLSSRNYDQADGKGRYKHGDKCNWLLKARWGRKIQVRFAGPRFSTYCYYDGPSCYQWVEIKYKKSLSLRGPRFCCNPGGIPNFNGKERLTSERRWMMIIFNAEYPLFMNKYSKTVPPHYMKGFKLCYRLAPL